MARLVMKFGGTSVGKVERIGEVADEVARAAKAGHEIAVVVSAMEGETNRLVKLTRAIAPFHDAREYDVVVSAGEQVSAGLLAIALQERGIAARSWVGWQMPVHTNNVHGSARIEKIDTRGIEAQFKQGRVAVVAGFQGVAESGRITTLGRGGSDTSAVALAAALKADRCDIYTDVDGVYTCDPRIVEKARKRDRVSFEEMLELASLGTKVLQTRSAELAMVYNVPLQIRSSFDTQISGTQICSEEEIVEQEVVTGIAYAPNEAKISLHAVPDKPGIASRIFGALAEQAVSVDMIVQSNAADGKTTDVTFTVASDDLARAVEVIEKAQDAIQYARLQSSAQMAKISIIGIGMRSHAGVAQRMFQALADEDINIHVISTSEIKVSVLIDTAHADTAVRTLHTAFDLDAND